ncbi:MAG: DUF4091 domain-containing protein [Candidatus Omnitrophica bacterium]|nr:DUF4091 domain-containing protein [Candidatus Omnitrophota bacterium]
MKNSKKIFIFLIGLILGCGLTFFAGQVALKFYLKAKNPKRFNTVDTINTLKGPSIQADFKIFAASSLDRIFQDGKTLEKPSFSTQIELSAGRNEYESAQVVVFPHKDLTNVKVQFSPLTDQKSGITFDSKNISIRKVGYVPTGEPYYPVKYVGFWPDPLMPQEKVDVAKDTFQPLWLTVYIPENAPAGNYQGVITVTADQIPAQTLPLQLRVYDFALPLASHLKTAFDFYGHLTKLRFPQGEKESDIAWNARIDEINDRFIIEMLKYRMNPILNIDPTVPADLGRVDRYLRYGISNFSIGRRGGTFNNNWPTDEESINNLSGMYRTYAELLKLNGMLKYTYIYSWDEGEIGNPIVNRVTGMIRRAHPGLINMVCYHGFWDPDQMPDWGKYIDIWTFGIDDFKEDAMRKLQKLGLEMWLYISGPSGYGSPNLALDFNSIDYRIIPWLCWKYDIKGFLYWCVNWWEKADPFLTAVNTSWGQNGNGLIFYPGTNGPIASVRAELYRDGMEDYEYFQLLIKEIKELKILKIDRNHQAEIDESLKLMTVDPTIAESMFSFTKDGDYLKKRRNLIAEKIERFRGYINSVNQQPQPTDPSIP